MNKDTKNQWDRKISFPEKTLNLLKMLEINHPSIPGYSTPRMEYLLYLISKKGEDDAMAILNMQTLRKQVPHAELYIRKLEQEGVITRDYYIPGERSYGYKFTDEYVSKPIIKYIDDHKLKKRIEPNSAKRFAWGYAVQNEYVSSFSVDQYAYEFAESKYTLSELNHATAIITSLENQSERYSIIDSSGRYYSPITNCKRALRQFIRVGDLSIDTCVDMHTSQPLLSTMFFTRPKEVAMFAQDRELANYLKNLSVPKTKDLDLYIEVVTGDDLYSFLIPDFEERGLVNSSLPQKEKRDFVKKEVMKIFYDRNREKLTKSKQVFRDRFPTVDSIFIPIRGKGRGERFPILLMALESNVILKKTYPIISNECKNTPIFTVHDAFLSHNNSETIKEILSEQLYRFTGFTPQLKIENISSITKQTTTTKTERTNTGTGTIMMSD